MIYDQTRDPDASLRKEAAGRRRRPGDISIRGINMGVRERVKAIGVEQIRYPVTAEEGIR